jgi:hypothetical protein
MKQLNNANQNVEAQKAALEEQVHLLTRKLQDNKLRMTQLETDTAQHLAFAAKQEILDYQHRTKKLSARICELTETLSAVQEKNTDYEHDIEALSQKLDNQQQCAMVANQQIATLQDQVLVLTAELEHEKNSSQKACDHIAALAAKKTNKVICDLMSELNAERETVLMLRAENEELTKVVNLNCKSHLTSDISSTVEDSSDHKKSEKIHEIRKMESEAEEAKKSLQAQLVSELKVKLAEKR